MQLDVRGSSSLLKKGLLEIRHANRDSNRFALQVPLGRVPFPIDGSSGKPSPHRVQVHGVEVLLQKFLGENVERANGTTIKSV